MTSHNPALRIDVADLLTHPAARRAVHLEAPVDSLAGSAARVPDDEPIVLDLVLERVSDGIVVRGTVRAVWRSTCGVCLTDLEHTLAQPVSGRVGLWSKADSHMYFSDYTVTSAD